MTESAVAPPAPTHRVLLRPTYRFAAWWTKGPGNHAGKILAMTPVGVIVLLIVWIYVINGACSLFADFDACATTFNVVNKAGIVGVLALVGFCFATLLSRLGLLIARARRRHRAGQELLELQRKLDGKDPLAADARYAELHRRWRDGTGPELLQRRVIALLLWPVALLPLVIFLLFALAQELFQEFGSIFVFEFSREAQDFALLEIGLVAACIVEFRLIRAVRECRRIVREHEEELDAALGAAGADLLRKHKDPLASAPDGPAFTFRAYGRNRPSEQNPY